MSLPNLAQQNFDHRLTDLPRWESESGRFHFVRRLVWVQHLVWKSERRVCQFRYKGSFSRVLVRLCVFDSFVPIGHTWTPYRFQFGLPNLYESYCFSDISAMHRIAWQPSFQNYRSTIPPSRFLSLVLTVSRLHPRVNLNCQSNSNDSPW